MNPFPGLHFCIFAFLCFGPLPPLSVYQPGAPGDMAKTAEFMAKTDIAGLTGLAGLTCWACRAYTRVRLGFRPQFAVEQRKRVLLTRVYGKFNCSSV
jgi:hypothetical protein